MLERWVLFRGRSTCVSDLALHGLRVSDGAFECVGTFDLWYGFSVRRVGSLCLVDLVVPEGNLMDRFLSNCTRLNKDSGERSQIWQLFGVVEGR